MTRILTFLAGAVLYLIGAGVLLVWMVVWLIPSVLLLELRWAVHGKPEGAVAPSYLRRWTTDRRQAVDQDKAAWANQFGRAQVASRKSQGLARRAGGLH